MSDLQYNGRIQAVHVLFTSARLQNDVLAVRQGLPFGARYGAVLIGPDISLPGGTTNNPPAAAGLIWSTQAGPGRPNVTFVQDLNYSWKRGHLVNGEWSGPGQWDNMTPLTPGDNSNHKTVEQYMRNFCQASLNYDATGPYKPAWYGIAYLVQCSTDPWAAVPANADLYSYAPAFIRVSWRAVRIPKPNLPPTRIQAYLDGYNGFPTVPVLPFQAPARPGAIGGACVPLGNVAGGPVFPYGGFYGPYPAAQANGFDGQIEIHQN